MRTIDGDKTLTDMWNALYAYEDKLEQLHGLDIIERLNIQNGFEIGQQVVANAPTVEVEPVRYGFLHDIYQIVSGEIMGVCSECGKEVPVRIRGNYTKYCPFCGAKVD